MMVAALSDSTAKSSRSRARKALERGAVEMVHGQDQAGAQALQHFHHAGRGHGIAAVDRHHHHVELPDLSDLPVGQRVMQVAQMADAHAGDLEDENGIAGGDHPTAGAADVGRDVADAHIGDGQIVLGRPTIGVPTAQHVLDAGIGKHGIVRFMRAVHGGDVGCQRRADVVVIVGGNPHPAGALDQPGGVSEEGEAHFHRLEGWGAIVDRLHQARVVRHGKTAIRARALRPYPSGQHDGGQQERRERP